MICVVGVSSTIVWGIPAVKHINKNFRAEFTRATERHARNVTCYLLTGNNRQVHCAKSLSVGRANTSPELRLARVLRMYH